VDEPHTRCLAPISSGPQFVADDVITINREAVEIEAYQAKKSFPIGAIGRASLIDGRSVVNRNHRGHARPEVLS
jgi:hypothetical protein